MPTRRPLLSISSWVSKSYEDVLRFASSLGFQAVELDCDEKPIPATRKSRARLKEIFEQYGLKIFFHSPFLDQAIGSISKTIRENTFNTLKMYLDFLEEYRAKYLVVHAGVDEDECPRGNVVDDLTKLVEIAGTKSITLSIENLRFGLSSDPCDLNELAEQCGSKITFDLGHANSCRWTLTDGRSSKDFLRAIENKVVSAHIYLKEEGGRHHPFTKIDEIKETLDHLNSLNNVEWWTIELPALDDVIRQKLMLDSYFKTKSRGNKRE